MRILFRFSIVLIGVVLLLAPEAFSQIDLDIESGVVFSGYNDVRIPGNGGERYFLFPKTLKPIREFFTEFKYSII